MNAIWKLLLLCCALSACNSVSENRRSRSLEVGETADVPVETVPAPIPSVAKRERFAAIFYFSGFGDSLYSAQNMVNNDIWVMQGQNPVYGPYGSSHFWGKPLWAAQHGGNISQSYRFYEARNPAKPNFELLNWHAQLLTDAGIDLIVLDFTNGALDFPAGPSYMSGTKALLTVWQDRRKRGLPTPKVAFFVKDEKALIEVEKNFLTQFPADLFFEYQGKKLLLVAQVEDAVPTEGRFANYTARHCWGLDNSGSYWQFKTNSDTPPPPFVHAGNPEQLSAPVSTQATYMTMDGKRVMNGARGRDDGSYFIRHMDAAIEARVTFVFIHSWNEWTAGNWGTQEAPHFVDQWMEEYSSDIEPMAGGHGWKYYELMKRKLAEFRAAP